MNFSLYAATVPSYRQIVGSVSGLLARAEEFCKEKGIAAEDMIQARLAQDMLPFAYQVKSAAVHSLGAIEGIRRGVFSPDMTPPPDTFAALHERIAATLAALQVVDAAEVDAFIGRDMRFAFGDRHIDLRPRSFCCPSPSPIFTFMRRPRTTFCAGRACPWESATLWEGCGRNRLAPCLPSRWSRTNR